MTVVRVAASVFAVARDESYPSVRGVSRSLIAVMSRSAGLPAAPVVSSAVTGLSFVPCRN